MVTKAEWAERVKRWGESGLGREEFAEGEGIDAKQLTWWRWKLRKEAAVAPKRVPVRFLPVRVVGAITVTTAVAESPIEVVLGNGRTIRVLSGFDAHTRVEPRDARRGFMLMLPPSVRVYIATTPTDVRKSFDGLSTLVAEALRHDPLSGHLYVFVNRRADQVRILFWDRTGYAVYAKRLAQGRFHFARATEEGATHIEVEATELALMLEGIDLTGAKRHKRWRPGEDIRTDARGRGGLGLSNPPMTTIHRAA